MVTDHAETMIKRADRVRAALSGVADPEIPTVSVLDLGIVRDIAGDGGVVTITPT